MYTSLKGGRRTYAGDESHTNGRTMSNAYLQSVLILAATVLAGLVVLLGHRISSLRRDMALIKALFEQEPHAVAVITADGRVIRINREFEKLFGYASADAEGKYIGELIVPADGQAQQQHSLDLLAEGQRVEGEGLYRRLDGSFFNAGITCAPLVLPDGCAAAYAIYKDISDQKRAEQAHAASEGRWRAFFDSSAVGIAVTNEQGRFTDVNRAYRETVGYSDDELRAMTFMDLTVAEDRPANAALFAELQQGKRRQFQMEKRYHRKDGRLVWVKTTVSMGRGGTVAPFGMAVVEDISERKEKEERLREYEKVVESARDLILVVDRDYRYLIANQAFLRYRGRTREQVIGRLVPEITGMDTFNNVIKPKLDECLAGHIVAYEMQYNYETVGERDVLVSYFPIEGGCGIDRVAAILHDITPQKRSNDELQQSFRQLRALTGQLQSVREEERTRLARELHDELGQALTAIKIDLASLQATPIGDWPAGRSLRIADLIELVNHTIRSVRRISTELRPGILDLGLLAAVEWAAEDFEARTGIRCHVSMPDAEPAIDPPRATEIFRIFQEALTNIARHSSASAASIRLAQENGTLLLEVRDNGCGIGQRNLSAFGSLGLLGMRERAVLLGGDFGITSDPEGGTTVRVRVPRADRGPAGGDAWSGS